jgi:uncharacterized protein YktA (UPF0223 family)
MEEILTESLIDGEREPVKFSKHNNMAEFYNYYKFITQNSKLTAKYKILVVNIRSIHTGFNILLSNLSSSIAMVDIIVLTEINANECDMKKYNIDGFKNIIKPRKGRGGGIAIYYREMFKIKLLSCNFSSAETLKLKINDELNLIAIYRPPSSNKKSFLQEIDQHLKFKSDQLGDEILVGDININLLKSADKITQDYETVMSENGFVNCIYAPTREESSGNNFSSTLIDHIFHKQKELHSFSAVIEQKYSDHYATSIILCGPDAQSEAPQFADKINYDEAYYMLTKIAWTERLQNLNVHEQCAKIAEIVQDHKNVNIERKYVKQKPGSRRLNKEWITEELEALISARDKMFRKHKSNPTNKNYRNEYVRFRNIVTFKIRSAKNNYYKRLFHACSGNSRNTWRLINDVMGRGNSSIDDTIMRYMAQDCSHDEILNKFGDQFSRGPIMLRHECNYKALKSTSQTQTNLQFKLPLINDATTEFLINKLQKKGPGFDNISANDIKNMGPNFISALTKLINLSIETCDYPNPLKTGVIRPIYKNGSHKNPCNYRPITQLNTLDKIFERHIDIQLTAHMNTSNLFDCRQYAYQKGRGVNQLFADLSEYLNLSMSEKDHTLGVFIDFSKAFDTIDHELMLKKLESIGVTGPTLKLFESFLSQRKFCVKVEGKCSDLFDNETGVPQGGILSAKLFIIYLLDLMPHLKKAKIFIFADDILILFNHKNLAICERTLQGEVNELCNWAHDNKLAINEKKTLGMHICAKNLRLRNEKPTIKIHTNECIHNANNNCDCKPIDFVREIKYLGIHIDEDLSWAPQIRNVVSKMRSVLREIKLAKARVTPNALRIIYFSLAHSHLIYGLPAWGKASLSKLLEIQNKILYTMSTKSQIKKHNGDVFKIWQVLPIDKTFEQNVILLKYFEYRGERRNHGHSTRQVQNMNVEEPKYKNKFQSHSWAYIMPRLWNKLPLELKIFSKQKTANENIKAHFLTKYCSRA